MKKPQPTEWNMRVTHPLNRVWLRWPDDFLEGCVITRHGVVYAYSQGGGPFNHVPHTDLQVVIDGRLYHRGVARRYTDRGLVTVARRFAEEIAGAEAARNANPDTPRKT